MMVKNIVTISLTIFIIAVVIILGAGVYMGQGKITSQTTQNNTPTGTNNSGNTTTTTASITSADVAKHNNPNDCWIVISGSVYNVTNFLSVHSGGAGQITPFCGKDATVAFQTKDGRGSHRSGDLSILSSYLVGSLSGTNNLPAPTNVTPRGSGGGDD